MDIHDFIRIYFYLHDPSVNVDSTKTIHLTPTLGDGHKMSQSCNLVIYS